MRLFLNLNTFISVLTCKDNISCQIMELVHGFGMYPATINENQEDVVSCIVHKGFKETSKNCKNFEEVAEYHLQCLIELEIPQVTDYPPTITNSKEDEAAYNQGY